MLYVWVFCAFNDPSARNKKIQPELYLHKKKGAKFLKAN